MSLTHLPSTVYRAIVRREVTTTYHNRFVQIFAALVLAGSLGTTLLSGQAGGVAFGVLLLFLYVVPLFGLLIGVSAAHEEHNERPFLWSQPVPRSAFVLGKTATLVAALAGVLLVALVPTMVVLPAPGVIALLWGLGVALVTVSVTAGVAVGQYTTNRARGLMVVLVVWFGAFALYDTLALAGAELAVMQNWPVLWVGLLLLNPVDAVRLAGLFSLESVPFSTPATAPWLADVISWLPGWVAAITVAWTGLLLLLACRHLRRLDL